MKTFRASSKGDTIRGDFIGFKLVVLEGVVDSSIKIHVTGRSLNHRPQFIITVRDMKEDQTVFGQSMEVYFYGFSCQQMRWNSIPRKGIHEDNIVFYSLRFSALHR